MITARIVREARVDSHFEGKVASVVVRAELGSYGIFVDQVRLNLGSQLESKIQLPGRPA
jgi:hypothetical protein